jgi:hypothetical protein
MNDEKGMPASTSAIPEAAHGTPPDKQMLLPVTHPPTDEWHHKIQPQVASLCVSAALELIIQRQSHQLKGQSRGLNLRPLEYKKLFGETGRESSTEKFHRRQTQVCPL